MAINRRLFLASLGAAVVVSVAGGYAISRDDDDDASDGGDDTADDSITLDQPGAVQDPTIGTNAAVAGTPFPVVDIEDADGNTVSTGDLIGQPLVVNFWFSTCPPCKKEMPFFAKVHAELGDRVRFVGVNSSTDSPETNRSFAADRGVRYELWRDPNGVLTNEVGITAFPVTLFVDAGGSIVRQTGELGEADLRELARELLG